jgi:homoserine acetyltransferase
MRKCKTLVKTIRNDYLKWLARQNQKRIQELFLAGELDAEEVEDLEGHDAFTQDWLLNILEDD